MRRSAATTRAPSLHIKFKTTNADSQPKRSSSRPIIRCVKVENIQTDSRWTSCGTEAPHRFVCCAFSTNEKSLEENKHGLPKGKTHTDSAAICYSANIRKETPQAISLRWHFNFEQTREHFRERKKIDDNFVHNFFFTNFSSVWVQSDSCNKKRLHFQVYLFQTTVDHRNTKTTTNQRATYTGARIQFMCRVRENCRQKRN